MFDIGLLLALIPAMPLVAAVVTAALGPRLLREQSCYPTVVALAVSTAASLILVLEVAEQSHKAEESGSIGFERVVRLWTWADVPDAYAEPSEGAAGGLHARAGVEGTGRQAASGASLPREDGPAVRLPFRVEVTLRADALTAVMLATVTLISLLVAVYSIGYMQGDPGYWRFFSYISLFVFSMTMLVSVSNFVLLYVFWEAVGLCSYLLIGFWYHQPEAAAAGKKAFLVNRVGDFGFALGVFLLWTTYGTLDFHDTVVETAAGHTLQTVGILGHTRLADPETLYAGGAVATAIALLLMLGACGKSAQLPLHVWLPDAMEGPTPVSALIHAATMVTAGVYMVARCMPLFVASTDAMLVVATIGGLTALVAAFIALTQTDLKRILAYSTISQLGYMFLGLGAGTLLGAVAGMFHLFTHAFFKALLFLGAGSVMHAMGGVIDVTRIGGLRRVMPWTHATFLVGCLALAGVFPFAGFWSKDLVLLAVAEQEGAVYGLLGWLAVVTGLLTAFYAFRAFFLTFYGEERVPPEAGHHAHESPPVMTVPLVVLAAGAIVVGALFELTHSFEHFLATTPSLAFAGLEEHGSGAAQASYLSVAATSTAVAVVGIVLAAGLYPGPADLLRRITELMKNVGLYQLSYGKLFFDPLYQLVVVWPLQAVAAVSYWADRYVIDGLVNLAGLAPQAAGAALRSLQNGLIPFYALAMVLGLLVLIGALMM